jgi:mono/diheme cytochrome c family protein
MVQSVLKSDFLFGARCFAIVLMLGLVGCGDYMEPVSTELLPEVPQQRAQTRTLPVGEFDVQGNYERQCLACHGVDSTLPDTRLIQASWDTVETLAPVIVNHPIPSDEFLAGLAEDSFVCEGACAQVTAEYMLDTLNIPVLYENQGQTLYLEQCAICHGQQGEGGSGGPLQLDTCVTCDTLDNLVKKTTDTMPTQNPALCIGTCAIEVSRYIKAGYMEVSAAPEQEPDQAPSGTDEQSDMPVGSEDPNDMADEQGEGDLPIVPGVDPGLAGTLTCDDAGKQTVYAETVHPEVLLPKCGVCHDGASTIGFATTTAQNSGFDVTNLEASYAFFTMAADPVLSFNGEPLMLARAVDRGNAHEGGRVFTPDSMQYTSVATMIDVLDAEGGDCEAPFRSLYEAFGIPFPGML